MKKVLGSMSGIIFAVFGMAVLALLMSLTYGALQRLFPNSFSNQMWGLVMFDIAAMCWALAFVFKSETVGQYATAGIGFVVAFLGTLGMVAAEVVLSGDLAKVDTQQIGRWMVYGFIIVTAIHAALLYAFHAAAPDIHEKINVGIARGEIVTEAIRQATQSLDVNKGALAESIHREIVDRVKRDLGIATRGNVIDLPALPVDQTPSGLVIPARKRQKQGAPAWILNLRNKFSKKREPAVVYEQAVPAVKQEQPTQAGAPANYGPVWENSEDISSTLDAYAWVCLKCEGSNKPYTRTCQWCGDPRINKSPVTAFADTPPIPKAEALAQAKALGMWNPNDPNDSPFERSRPDVHKALTQAAKAAQEDKPSDPGDPFQE